MLTYYILSICMSLIFCGSTTQGQWRVFNGTVAMRGQFPFIAHIGRRILEDFWCTATILNSDTLLTAGHCVCDFEPNIVVVGTTKIVPEDYKYPQSYRYEIREIIIHPSYTESLCGRVHAYDIAIIKLKTFITFDRYIKTIPYNCDKVPAGELITHIGYGLDEEGNNGILKYGREFTYWKPNDERLFTSADPSHILPGDSGGPAVLRINGSYVQVGVNSGYLKFAKPSSSIYAPIAASCDFIKKYT